MCRRGDSLLVVPVLAVAHADRVRELLDLTSRPDPTGLARTAAVRALVDLRSPSEMPGFALFLRSGRELRTYVHDPVRLVVDGRVPGAPGAEPAGRLAEHALEDGAWHELTVAADRAAEDAEDAEDAADAADAEDAADVAAVLPLDLQAGVVPGGGVTLHGLPAAWSRRPERPERPEQEEVPVPVRAPTSSTALRPAVQFRSILLGECAARAPGAQPARPRRAPLPVAGARTAVTTGPEVIVEGVLCPRGHFTDPAPGTCPTCGTALTPDARRVRLPRPPLGVIVTDAGTIYTVSGDFVLGRDPERAPDVLEGRARPLALRDAARSTSRVHARLTVQGWKVLLSDDGSANGTFVSRQGAAGPWLPVPPRVPVPLLHGDRVRLGRRQLLFDTWRETVLPQAFR